MRASSLLVKVREPATEGKANDAVLLAVADAFGVRPRAVRLVHGRGSRRKLVEVTIDVNPDRTVANATVVDKSRYGSDPFFRAAADSAVRAVRNPRCSPLELPADKYDQWKHIDFTFDPRDML